MPETAGQQVVVTSKNAGKIEQVNDAGNRASRSFVNMTPFSFGVLVLDQFFHISISPLLIAGFFQFGVPLISGARRWFEIRKDVLPRWLKWLVFAPPPLEVTTAPAKTPDGAVIGTLTKMILIAFLIGSSFAWLAAPAQADVNGDCAGYSAEIGDPRNSYRLRQLGCQDIPTPGVYVHAPGYCARIARQGARAGNRGHDNVLYVRSHGTQYGCNWDASLRIYSSVLKAF